MELSDRNLKQNKSYRTMIDSDGTGHIRIIVTIQPLKTGRMMLILWITLIAIINLWTLKKRNQSAAIKGNQLI